MLTTAPPLDECYRCGYDLRGINDDQPCPECGLLAQRSRRQTDELHNTRPGWLRTLSRGIWLILLALALPCIVLILIEAFRWEVTTYLGNLATPDWVQDLYELTPAYLFVMLLGIGIILFTVREGYPPADQADRKRRLWLRICMLAPVTGLVFLHLYLANQRVYWWSGSLMYHLLALLTLTIGMAPMALLLFLQLRDLGRRARNAHLVEHCRIVGIGMSLALVYCAGMLLFQHLADGAFGSSRWWERSMVPIFILLVGSVAASLFILWGVYLLVRFALAFRRASRELQLTWKRDDRAVRE